jgi:hypothetical protein
MAILAMVITGLGKTVCGFPRTLGQALGAWTCGFGAPIDGVGKAGASIDAFGVTAASQSIARLKWKRRQHWGAKLTPDNGGTGECKSVAKPRTFWACLLI